MKRLTVFLFIIAVWFSQAKSARIITSFDIANWYLSSDLVITGKVVKNDSVGFISDTTLASANFIYVNTYAREKYQIEVESVIKGRKSGNETEIFTPLKLVSQTGHANGNPEGIVEIPSGTMGYDDYFWFEMRLGEQKIIMLGKRSDTLEVLCKMEISKDNLSWLDSIDVWKSPFNPGLQKTKTSLPAR